MRPLIGLCLLAALALPACAAAPTAIGASAVPTANAAQRADAALMPATAAGFTSALRATSAVGQSANTPLGALDCDRDGYAGWSEVVAGLLLNDRRISAEEFAAADLSRDGKWSEGELARFLNHRARSSWLLLKACGSYADH